MRYSFQKLDRDLFKHITGKFCSGNSSVDNFINSTECFDLGVGVTYVFLDDKDAIIAYFNISTGSILDPSNNSLKIGGSIHINKFGLDQKYQGTKLAENNTKFSDVIFYRCLKYIIRLREYVGFAFITLCSTEEGVHLYTRAGFEPVDEDMRIAHDFKEKGCYEMYLVLDLED